MSTNKTLIIVLSSFVTAAVLCLIVGIALYFTAIGLPASADNRGARVLAGVVVIAVGAFNGVLSLAALFVVAVKNWLAKKNGNGQHDKD